MLVALLSMKPARMILRQFAAASIALALLASLSARHALAQSADLVLCDRVAADPGDPDKPKDIQGSSTIVPSDVAIAIKFCKVAAAKSRRAHYELGRAYAANKQMAEAVAAYRKAAAQGSTAAMVELGVLLGTGTGVDKDEAQARKLFERAAAAGNPRGMTDLAALPGGGSAAMDPTQQRRLLAKAADGNSAEVQFQLGLMYANGAGGPQNDVAARALFEKAAAQHHPRALDWMGAFAQSGRGGPKDAGAAKAYYEKAAALGDEDAKAALKRLDCPYVIKDKQGHVVTNLCF